MVGVNCGTQLRPWSEGEWKLKSLKHFQGSFLNFVESEIFFSMNFPKSFDSDYSSRGMLAEGIDLQSVLSPCEHFALLPFKVGGSFSCWLWRPESDIDSNFNQQKIGCVHSDLLIKSFSYTKTKSILTHWPLPLWGCIGEESPKAHPHLTSLS